MRAEEPPARALLRDTGGILLAFFAALAAEALFVLVAHGRELVAGWEVWRLLLVVPVAASAAVPAAIALAGLGRLAHVAAPVRLRVAGALGAASGAVVGLGVSGGRHFAQLPVRASFVLAVALVAGVVAAVLARMLVASTGRHRLVLGLVVLLAAWLVDHLVLVRLYPAFHAALVVVAMAGAATTWSGLPWTVRRFGLLGVVLTFAALAAAPRASGVLATSDNVRTALLDHAPWLGRGVVVAARLAPPPPLEDDPADADPAAPSGPRTLDWSGRDVVLVTIDALRADHVGAYGYGRSTTPNIDALAARGVRFDHAYCPTPHTSYSVSSLMTGKYMRPLLALDPDGEHDTWAGQLRRYGYRTAAFYPPAVFFIDQPKFARLEATHLGFEYQKVEFADPALRASQVERYLAAPEASGRPLFLWVHAFEPHEPYVAHPEHPFSGGEGFDAYDSEIAAADALVGDVVRLVEARRPGAVVIVSADHGEEFGDHGGRYHGTTVYEEQVRVPLVVAAPGLSPRVVRGPVQTIDLLPTVLAALDIPRPARIRGRDLGPVLAGKGEADEGFAFAETDDFTLVARGKDRLVCQRKVGACTLYDVEADPHERSPVTDRPDRIAELKKAGARLARDTGRMEASTMPAALRLCAQGDRDAAEEVGVLFDDARVDVRRAAARCAFKLRAPELAPQLRRAKAAADEDANVRAWATLALAWTRTAEHPDPTPPEPVAALLHDGDPDVRRGAALVLAFFRDPRGEAVLLEAWPAAARGELEGARALLDAFTKLKSRAAVPVLSASLDDVRLRSYVADALREIGDPRARGPLLAHFRVERYLDARAAEARALTQLDERSEAFRAALARFAGLPVADATMFEAAYEARVLGKAGAVAADARPLVADLEPDGDGPHRLWIYGATADAKLKVGEREVAPMRLTGWVAFVELDDVTKRVHLEAPAGTRALWLVRRADELPPPPPEAWDAGAEDASAP